MHKEDLGLQLYQFFRNQGEVLDDPDRFCRLIGQMMNTSNHNIAFKSATEFFDNRDYPLVHPECRCSVFEVLSDLKEEFSYAAFANMFRFIWVKHGIATDDTDYLIGIINWIKDHEAKFGSNYLMSSEEYNKIKTLPAMVTAYRGQMIHDNPKVNGITGHSWTLNKQIADYYTVCGGHKNGWLISAEIPKEHVHLFFGSRGEEEIVVDVRHAKINSVEKGKAKNFPAHLSEPDDIFLLNMIASMA